MKKTLILLIFGVLPLSVGVSFAASDLSRQLSALTEQILAESEHPFTQLEELKKLFSHCAEEHTDPILKTACQSWLDKSYPAIKEHTPQQVFIELGTDDIEVKKIGETSVFFAGANEPEIADHYQLTIPKYQLKLTFPLQKGMIPAQYLSTWQWAK
ncbi:MAG: hypothetical protein Q4B28_07215 [bacterium]|nr:hypothetical protein [bacterium]